MVPRKWSNKSQKGAVRVPSKHLIKPYQGPIVDPFSDWSKAFYKFKAREGRKLSTRRRESNKWKQRKIALHRKNTELDGISLVITF